MTGFSRAGFRNGPNAHDCGAELVTEGTWADPGGAANNAIAVQIDARFGAERTSTLTP